MENIKLLDDTRIGILISSRQDGSPIGVPVWFDWNGEKISCFAAKDSQKVKRLKRSSRASLLVTNIVGEPEAWVSVDGEISIKDQGATQLIEKLSPLYWDLSNEVSKKTLDEWLSYPDAFVLLELIPTKIRSGS